VRMNDRLNSLLPSNTKNVQCNFYVCERAVKTIINDEAMQFNFSLVFYNALQMAARRNSVEVRGP